jgi:hypothetical protein
MRRTLRRSWRDTITILKRVLKLWLWVCLFVEQVSSSKYLESIVNETEEEIESRIVAGNRAYHANKQLLTNKLLSKNSEMRVYKTIIRPVVTYGSETWMMNIIHKEKLKILERKMLRSTRWFRYDRD